MKCSGDPVVSYEYFYSVDNSTYYRATATFDLTMTQLEYRKFQPLFISSFEQRISNKQDCVSLVVIIQNNY